MSTGSTVVERRGAQRLRRYRWEVVAELATTGARLVMRETAEMVAITVRTEYLRARHRWAHGVAGTTTATTVAASPRRGDRPNSRTHNAPWRSGRLDVNGHSSQ